MGQLGFAPAISLAHVQLTPLQLLGRPAAAAILRCSRGCTGAAVSQQGSFVRIGLPMSLFLKPYLGHLSNPRKFKMFT